MSVPAFDVVLAAARHLEARPFYAAAGSTTTVIQDATFAAQSQSTDAYKGGTILAKTPGASSNQLATITASATGSYTVSPALGAAPAAGDLLFAIGLTIPHSVLLAKLAEALLDCGESYSMDTSLVTVSGQREYTIPTSAAAQRDVIRVELERQSTSPTLYDLDPGVRVDLERGVIAFTYDPPAGLKIRLLLSDLTPANITTASLSGVTIPNNVSPAWLALDIAARCALWRLLQIGSDTTSMQPWVNDLRARADAMRSRQRRTSPAHVSVLANAEVA